MDLLIVKLRRSLNNVFSVCVYCFRCAINFIDLAVCRLVVDCFVETSRIFFYPPILLWSFVILNFLWSQLTAADYIWIRRQPLVIVIRSYGLEISVKFGYYVSAKNSCSQLWKLFKKREAKITSGRGFYSETIKVFYILQFIPKSCIFLIVRW